MENKVKNLVCNGSNSNLTKEIEQFIQMKLDKDKWDLETIQDSMIVALQNKLLEYNYHK